MSFLIWKWRRYPIRRDERGRSLRRQAFDLFDEGHRPAEIFKRYSIDILSSLKGSHKLPLFILLKALTVDKKEKGKRKKEKAVLPEQKYKIEHFSISLLSMWLHNKPS